MPAKRLPHNHPLPDDHPLRRGPIVISVRRPPPPSEKSEGDEEDPPPPADESEVDA